MNIIQRNKVHCLPAAAHDAPTLVYGHGFGCNKDMWSRVTPAFTPAYRQVLFDYVGRASPTPAPSIRSATAGCRVMSMTCWKCAMPSHCRVT